jgi:MFS family permease
MLMAIAMLTPIYAIFVQDIGGDILSASGAWALFTLTSGVLILLFGRLEDKASKKGIQHQKFITLGYFIRSLAFIGYFFVTNTFQLFAVQVLLGIGFAASIPAYDSLYSKFLSKGHYATEWSAWEGMNMIVAAIGAVIGGVIANFFGFKTLFLVMFTSSLIGLVISTFLNPKISGKKSK